jgi:eukaryotic-like serine/threonine-protein kinase
MAVRIESHAEPIPGYRLIERIGGGGFGEVWKAEAPGGLFKAIKFVFGDLSAAGDNGQRAEQELKALSRVKTVRHPYILSLERYEVIDGQLIIVMELADKNLFDRYKECRALGLPGIPREELLGYMEETAEALDLMNGQYQLQHLDIKPQNLFLVHQHVKVADFGLVKDLEGMAASVTGGVTPVYAAPETFDGWVSRYCDQYSLAIVYQELLTGQRPFHGSNVRQLVMQHLQGVPDLSSLPPSDRAIIARALAKSPEERHASCKDMVRALRHGAPSVFVPRPDQAGGAVPVEPAVAEEKGDAGPADGVPRGETDASEGATQWIGSRDEGRQRTPASAGGREAPPEAEGDGVLFPALVVGVGRLGLAVLQQLRAGLRRRFGSLDALPHLRFLYLDTDPEAQRGPGRVPGEEPLLPQDTLLVPLNRPGHYLKPRDGRIPVESWLDPHLVYRIPRTRVTLGVRALGRLAFCDHYRAIARRLHSHLESCLEPEALEAAVKQTGLGLRSNRPRVYVVAGLAGGTGGGVFLDLAYVLRRQLKQLGYRQPDVVGLLVAPEHAPEAEDEGARGSAGKGSGARAALAAPRQSARMLTQSNAFAALTELSHFATPGNTFHARYHDQEPAIQDSEPPFTRWALLPLPEEAGEAGAREVAALAGEFLGRDLASPLGQAAALARAGLPAPPWPERGLFCQTFGLYQFISPHRPMVERAARGLCARLLQRWITKDAGPVRTAVEARVREQWAGGDWDPGAVFTHLGESARAALGQEPADAFAAHIDSLVPPPPADPRGRAAAAPPEAAKVREALFQLEDVVGPPAGAEVMGRAAQLPDLLRDAVRALIAGRGQRAAEVIVGFIEQPEFRLAGAEEAVRQMVSLIERVLAEHEPKLKEATALAVETHKRILLVAAALQKSAAAKARPPATAAEVGELLRQYARSRYDGLVLQQVIAVYVSLRGQLTDQLREINFCRVRLGELLHAFGAGLPPLPDPVSHDKKTTAGATPLRIRRPTGDGGQPGASRQTPTGLAPVSGEDARSGAGVGCSLYPDGCRNMDEVIERYLAGLTPEVLQELDRKVQGVIEQQFTALVQVCLTSANVLDDLERAMQQEAEAFVAGHTCWGAAGTSVAELFLAQHADEELACGAIVNAFDEAAPRLGSGPDAMRAPAEVAVLMAPPDPAGERFRALALAALPGTELAPAAGAEDLVLYRELPYVKIADLDQLGPPGQEAYQQMLAVEHFTPHTRTDVAFTPAVAPRASAIG